MIARIDLLALFVLAFAMTPSSGVGQEPADSARLRDAARDYIEGWYTGDAARMRRALHPELAKRMVWTDPASGRSRLDQMSALTLIESTERGGGSEAPAAQRTSAVRILDVFENAAVVRVDAGAWIDYLSLAKWNGEWRIINVLWELRPRGDAGG